MKKRRLLSRTARAILRSGALDPGGRCQAPEGLVGSARVAVLHSLSDHGLVRVTNWGSTAAHGSLVGTITPLGLEAHRDGYL